MYRFGRRLSFRATLTEWPRTARRAPEIPLARSSRWASSTSSTTSKTRSRQSPSTGRRRRTPSARTCARGFGRSADDARDRAGRDVEALIITGKGAFCAAGTSRAQTSRSSPAGVGPNASRNRMQSSRRTIYNLFHIELPVITLVDGPAAGAGCNIALAGDFVLATPRAFFMQAFARIGLVPDWSGFYILPRLVGMQRAKELVYSGRRVYASRRRSRHDRPGRLPGERDGRGARLRQPLHPYLHHGGRGRQECAEPVLQPDYAAGNGKRAARSICRDTEFHRAGGDFAEEETPLFGEIRCDEVPGMVDSGGRSA